LLQDACGDSSTPLLTRLTELAQWSTAEAILAEGKGTGPRSEEKKKVVRCRVELGRTSRIYSLRT